MSAPYLRNVRLLALFNFCVDFRLYGPVMIIYFERVTGSYLLATAVLSVTMLSSAALEIPTGVASDRFGRVPVIAIGAGASSIAVALYAWAPAVLMLFVAAVFEGLSRALYNGNNDALLYETLAEHGRESEYAEYSGRVASMFQLALAISAFAGGFVAAWSLRAAVGVSVIPQVAALVIALQLREPNVRGPIEGNAFAHIGQALQNLHSNPLLRRLIAAKVLIYGAGETAFQLQPAFVYTLWPTWAVGVMRTATNGLGFVSYVASGRIIARFGVTRTLLVGTVWTEALNLVALLKPTLASPAFIAAESLAYGSGSTAQNTLQQSEFTDRERATMGSLVTLLGSLVFGLVSLSVGAITDHFGIRTGLLACQAVGLVAVPLVWSVHRHHRNG